MNITLFNKNYWVRRFSEPVEKQGYMVSTHSDFVASMNVHPMGADSIQMYPEGERKVKRLEAESTAELVAADQSGNVKADLLYYHGAWYECVSAAMWDHTILSHTNYQFVIVPGDASGSTDLAPPTGDPDNYA